MQQLVSQVATAFASAYCVDSYVVLYMYVVADGQCLYNSAVSHNMFAD